MGVDAWKYLKLVEVQCNVLLLINYVVELDVQNDSKGFPRMWENE